MTQVTIEEAYREACQAIGEASVQQRLMLKAVNAQIEKLTSERDKAIANQKADSAKS